jgi:predicted MFS family arabinose efflux permease
VRTEDRDRRLLYVAACVRSFGYGLTSVVLGLYLAALGLDTARAGLALTAALGGVALTTLAVSFWADRFGRRRTLVVLSVLTALAGALYAAWPHYGPLLLAGLLGGVYPTGKDRGAFSAVEQGVLPQVGGQRERNWLFARYNLLGTLAAALGALAAGATRLFGEGDGAGLLPGYRAAFALYAVLVALLVPLYVGMSPGVESAVVVRRGRTPGVSRLRSRRIIAGLSALFFLDSFGGALIVQSFLAFWFHTRFGANVETLGTVFFVSGVLSALSFLVAARLATRIGLLNTVVFTHLPSSVLIIFVPFMPTLWLALGIYLVREALSQMDVPTRQSYTVAVVAPEERTAAAGITALSRNLAQTFSPSLGGVLGQAFGPASPFVVCGLIKTAYDLVLYRVFRHIRPAEEQEAKPEVRAG